MRPLLDAVLLDIGGTLVREAPPATAVEDLEPEPCEDALEDLLWLLETVRIGAVTDTSVMREQDVRAALAPTGLAELLEVVVTSVDTGAAKPDPASLRSALTRMGLTDPARVLFVGNDPVDEAAAEAAGMPFADVRGNGSGPLTVRGAVQKWLDKHAGHRFEAARAAITKADLEAANAAAARQESLTKPPGSLGRLEALGTTLAGIAGTCPPPVPERATVAVFAADHGIVNWNVTPWPQEVTAQMVANFVGGGAAVNVLARHAGAEVLVVDVGVASPLDFDDPCFIRRKIHRGTANLAEGPAMTRTDALLALDVGAEIAEQATAGGAECLLTGDMGIGNTTPATAIIAAVTNRPAAEITGRGSGSSNGMLERKTQVIEAVTENLSVAAGAMTLLEQVGGFEIAAMAGFIVGGAAARVPVIVDGVVADAALLIAAQLAPDVVDFVIAGHRSAEPAASAALEYLGLDPVIDLDLRLGEGTGALLALPVVQAAAKVLGEMATFDDAGIDQA